MSDENNVSYHYNSTHDHNMGSEGFSFPCTPDQNHYSSFMYNQQQPLQNPTGCDPSCMSFTSYFNGAVEYNTPSNPFNLSSSLSAVVYPVTNGLSSKNLATTAAENPLTPNSSVSISSPEAGVEEDSLKSKKDLQQKLCEDGDVKSQKDKVIKKKGEKKERLPRFAFVTKSEVDNLEDGYRWRKYGQKAVKNSTFPRSYYRCTSQKCNVKKRIERSYEDSSVVITTYEGQHNHHSPSILRGNAAAMLPPSLQLSPPLPFPGSHQDFILPTSDQQNRPSSSNFSRLISPQLEQPQLHDQYRQLFPNMVSDFLHKPQPSFRLTAAR